jgi:hypothetical protein
LPGPGLRASVRETLEPSETDEDGGVFHAVIQTRSTPESPYHLSPASLRGPYWRGRDTLVFPVELEEWGPLNGIDDDAKRERLQSAGELVTMAGWSVTPALSYFPSNVDLAQVHRD